METDKRLNGSQPAAAGADESRPDEAGQPAAAPDEAAPHWQSFYAAVRDAIAAMRPNGLKP